MPLVGHPEGERAARIIQDVAYRHRRFFLLVALNQEDALLGSVSSNLRFRTLMQAILPGVSHSSVVWLPLSKKLFDQGRRFVAGDLLGHNQVGHLLDLHPGLHLQVDAVAGCSRRGRAGRWA